MTSTVVRVQVPPRVPSKVFDIQGLKLLGQNRKNLSSLLSSVLEPTVKKPLYPYRPARLVIPDPNSKNQSWLIKFYIWHEGLQRLVMKRDYDCNNVKDLEERKKWCKERIKEINLILSTGAYISATESNENTLLGTPKSTTVSAPIVQAPLSQQNLFLENNEAPNILEAIDQTLTEKRHLKHFRDYNQKLLKFKQWLIDNNLSNHNLSGFSHKYIKQFALLLKEQGLGTRTINNYLNTIGLIFNTFNNDSSSDSWVRNPLEKIKKEKNPKGKNIAYLPFQQKEILDYIAQSSMPHYELISVTMFYTLARTAELSYLQPWMIGAKQPDQIYFPAEICKNKIEKHVTIPDELEAIFTKYKVRQLPKNWFVFSNGLQPGPNHYNEKYIGNRYRENILDKIGYAKDYTLYSWKHTGVCMYFMCGVPVAQLMMQAGWEDPHTFKQYLKSLGLFDNSELKAKSPKLPL